MRSERGEIAALLVPKSYVSEALKAGFSKAEDAWSSENLGSPMNRGLRDHQGDTTTPQVLNAWEPRWGKLLLAKMPPLRGHFSCPTGRNRWDCVYCGLMGIYSDLMKFNGL